MHHHRDLRLSQRLEDFRSPQGGLVFQPLVGIGLVHEEVEVLGRLADHRSYAMAFGPDFHGFRWDSDGFQVRNRGGWLL